MQLIFRDLKDEIKIKLENGTLTINAAKGLDKDEKDKEGKYVRRERYAGSMSRSFYVGKHVTAEQVHPKYENGILTFEIPKNKEPIEEKKSSLLLKDNILTKPKKSPYRLSVGMGIFCVIISYK